MLELLLLFLSVIVGGMLGFWTGGKQRKYLSWALSFSAAFILAITVLHLLPIVYHDFELRLGLWILGGFFLQIFLESLSHGVEHGHVHSVQNASKRWAVQIVLGLSIHAFLEGMPLLEFAGNELAADHDHTHGQAYFLSVILHKLPAAFAMVLLLKQSGFKNSFMITCLIIFASMSPLGAISLSIFQISDYAFHAITALVIGAFLHISTTILFESDKSSHHKISWDRLGFSLIGLILAVLTSSV